MLEKIRERKIKKNLYGRPQSILAIFPAGLGMVSLTECQTILADPWLPTQFIPELILLKNEIRINNIHLFQVMELLIRSQLLTDLRLIIGEGKVSGKNAFEKKCREIPWECYVNQTLSLKLKVDSIASRAFHETGLKTILSEILAEYVNKIVSGENTQQDTIMYAHLYRDKLALSLSLAGDFLYKRGYRGVLSASAPLREDAAAGCIQNSLHFARQCDANYLPKNLVIPFSGTGTFAFEYLQMQFHFVPGLIRKAYAMQKMPFFRQASFDFLLKKAKEYCEWDNEKLFFHLICIDHSQTANAAFANNRQAFIDSVEQQGFIFPKEIFSAAWMEKDFFAKECLEAIQSGDIFMPLNPPYGIRLGKNADSVIFYKKIANKINLIAQKKKGKLAGFILCPSQETWDAFRKTLLYKYEETYHFTQGGMDIRVCQFFVG